MYISCKKTSVASTCNAFMHCEYFHVHVAPSCMHVHADIIVLKKTRMINVINCCECHIRKHKFYCSVCDDLTIYIHVKCTDKSN